MKRLLCIDDSPEMLEILVEMLQPEFQIVGTLSSGSSAVIEAANCPAKVAFLSVHESIDFVQAAQKLGAAGYVFKSQITRDLVKTLHAAI